jgi:hypothetical protein
MVISFSISLVMATITSPGYDGTSKVLDGEEFQVARPPW